MRLNIVAPVLAVIVVAAFLYFSRNGWPQIAWPAFAPTATTTQTVSGSPDTSAQVEDTATNYDECIAEGNKPLPDAPDKCLTKSGHIFIQGVTE